MFSNFNEYAASGFPTTGSGLPALLTVTVAGNTLDFSTDGLAGEDVEITFNVTSGMLRVPQSAPGPGIRFRNSSLPLRGEFRPEPSEELCNGTIQHLSRLDSSGGFGVNGKQRNQRGNSLDSPYFHPLP